MGSLSPGPIELRACKRHAQRLGGCGQAILLDGVLLWFGFFRLAALLEAEALPIHLQNVDMMG